MLFTLGKKASREDLGLRPAPLRDILIYGCGSGIILLLFMLAISWPMSRLIPDLSPQLYETMLRNAGHGAAFVVLFFMGAVLAPISEELFYRAMIYPYLRGVLGPVGGICWLD